jgi:hypothetical protein
MESLTGDCPAPRLSQVRKELSKLPNPLPVKWRKIHPPYPEFWPAREDEAAEFTDPNIPPYAELLASIGQLQGGRRMQGIKLLLPWPPTSEYSHVILGIRL